MIRKITNKDGTVRYQAIIKVLGQKHYAKFESRQAADKWINDMRYKRDNKVSVASRVTIGDLFRDYIENAKNKGNAPSSILKAERAFENHLKPFYEDFNMATVGVAEHKSLITFLRQKKLKDRTLNANETDNTLSNASINRLRALMSSMYNLAVVQRTYGDLITFNPFQAIAPMKEMNQRLDYWDDETIKAFLESEKQSHYYPLWVLMLNTGLRIGETVALHRDQVDRFAGILTVDRMFCMATNSLRDQTKSSQVRFVGLNDMVKRVLYPLLDRKQIFVLPDGKRLTSYYMIKTVFPNACKKADVRNIGLHGLRHTYASHYVMKGGNLYDLQNILGHSDIKTTMRYAHLSKRHMHQKSNVVGFEGNVIEVNFNQQEACA